jgi:acyl carrier protein
MGKEGGMNAVGVDAIRQWLVTQLAEQLGSAPQDIDGCQSFSEYGLDSLTGISLAGDLQEWLGISLSPTLLWEYPSVDTLAQYLAEAVTPQSTRTAQGRSHTRDIMVDPGYAARLLTQLDSLSDEEVDTLLSELAVA